MNLSELTPDEQRARIEEIWENRFTTFITMDELQTILRLALAAVPKIEWRDIVDEIDIQVGRQSNYGLLTLMAYKLYPDGEDTDPQWIWALEYDNDALVEGRTDTLEAAQAAAEAALLKLIGGTE